MSIPLGKTQYPYIEAPIGFDAGWIAGLKAVNSRVVGVAFIADSIGQGLNTTDFILKRYARLFRNALLNMGFPLAGEWYQPADSALYISPTSWNGTPPWTLDSGGTRSYQQWAFGTSPWYTTNSADDIIQFQAPDAHVDADVLYWDYVTPGSWKYSIDGAARVTVNTAGLSKYTRLALAGDGSLKRHAYAFGTQNADQRLLLAGIVAWLNRSFGLGFSYVGVNGIAAQSRQFSAIPPDSIKPWQGYDGSAQTGLGFPSAPDLVIYSLGVNDCQTNASTVASYARLLDRQFRAFRRGNPLCSIVCLIPWLPDGSSSDVAASGVNQEWNYPYFQRAMYRVAKEYNAAVINIDTKWGEYALANGFISGTNIHPVDAGHLDIYSSLANLLLDF